MKKSKERQKIRGNASIAGRLWQVVVEMLLVFGVFFMISIVVISNESRNNYAIRESETLINGVAGSIHANIDNYKDLTRLIMLKKDVINFLRAKEVDAGLMNDAHYGVMDVLSVCNNVDSVFIFRNDGEYMSTGRTEYDVDVELMADEAWKSLILDRRGGAVVVMNGNGAVHRKNGTQILTIARAIYDINTQKRTGILLMNISIEMLDKIVVAQEPSNVAIFAPDSELLAGDEFFEDFYDENYFIGEMSHREEKVGSSKKMVSAYDLPDLPLKIMCVTSAPSRITLSRAVFLVLSLLLVVFIVSVINTSFFITRNITRPLFNLADSMEKTKQSGWLEKIDIDVPNNEIGTLSDSYNNMIEHLNVLFTSLIEKEKSVQKAEMRVLHEQIKPHFLYNSMETIGFMALDAGAENVYEALETLGSFYRNFLSKGSREIPLSREIHIIKDYLSLQKLRYGDIIVDSYNIEEDSAERLIPKLILQPLVENCIYHGIRPKGECCEIKISTFIVEGDLHIVVLDTGIGMTEEAINRALSSNPDEMENDDKDVIVGGSGFGLRGTIERIRYYCNKEDVVSIESEPGEYTKIEIVIPEKTVEEGAE